MYVPDNRPSELGIETAPLGSKCITVRATRPSAPLPSRAATTTLDQPPRDITRSRLAAALLLPLAICSRRPDISSQLIPAPANTNKWTSENCLTAIRRTSRTLEAPLIQRQTSEQLARRARRLPRRRAPSPGGKPDANKQTSRLLPRSAGEGETSAAQPR